MQIQFIKKYLSSLKYYISHPKNTEIAFQLGKEAIGNGLTILDMVEVHRIALDALLASQKKYEADKEITQQIWTFFQESLAAYDIDCYQYQYTNATLQQISQSLDKRIIEQSQELRGSEKRYRLLIETMNDGFAIINENYLLTYVNKKLCDMLGYLKPDELINCSITELFDSDNLKLVLKYLVGDSQSFEVEWIKKEGQKLSTIISPSSYFDVSANANFNFIVITDITERKLAEELLLKERTLLTQRVEERTAELSRTNAELSRAVRLKDEFLATMSHELRSPLNTILASAEILQEQIFGSLNQKQFKYIQNLEKSARHLLCLINDILDLSKIEAGKMTLQLESFSVKEICENSLAFIKELALKKKLQVNLNIDDTVKIIYADSLRLKQILINLLSNAVKFSHEKDKIGLEVVSYKEQEAINFTVWDTGIGIAESDIPKLFQSFVQIDASLARLYEGTGLGLALVRRLAEMHGGSVSVKSEVNKGSRFTVSLPWLEKYQVLNNLKVVNHKVSNHVLKLKNRPAPLILLAEDNEDNIVSLSDYLQLHGYKVRIVRNGKEAIESIREEQPALILMDIQMPIMNGLEAIQQIRADTDFSNIPIIALTALAMPGDKERCLVAGADKYLTKPVHLKSLIELIETQL
jgi:PAS domain S-box-containing protein